MKFAATMMLSVAAHVNVIEAMVGGILDVTCSDCGANHAKVDTLAPLTFKTSGSTSLVGSGIVDVDVTADKLIACATAHWSRMQQWFESLADLSSPMSPLVSAHPRAVYLRCCSLTGRAHSSLELQCCI